MRAKRMNLIRNVRKRCDNQKILIVAPIIFVL
jgi:hypothetical protein